MPSAYSYGNNLNNNVVDMGINVAETGTQIGTKTFVKSVTIGGQQVEVKAVPEFQQWAALGLPAEMIMGFKIESQLDLSDGFDENSLLGKIRLTDGVHSIAEESVYLDSWLDALWAGSRNIRNSSSKSAIEIPEHPQPLRVHRDRTGAVHLAFRDTEVTAPSTDEFEQAVLSAIAGFTDEVSMLSGKEYELPSSQGG